MQEDMTLKATCAIHYLIMIHITEILQYIFICLGCIINVDNAMHLGINNNSVALASDDS